jgi:hypothetical protein
LSFLREAAGTTRAMASLVGDLLARPVRLHGIELGRPVGVVVDPDARRVVGVEVRCGDGALRFLPLSGMRVGDEDIVVSSAFSLLDDVAFYRSRGRGLEALRGSGVSTEAGPVGTLHDVVFEPDGRIIELVVATPGGELRFAPGPDVRIAARRAPAA